MATYHVEAPDGSQYEVEAPDNAKPQDVYAVLKARLPQSGKPSAPLSPIDQEADKQVADLAAKGLPPTSSAVKGVPILGSWLDEISAAGEAGLNKVTGGRFGQPYDKALAFQHARDRYIEQNDPKGQFRDNLIGGLGTAPILPFAKVLPGEGAVSTLGNIVLNGGMYGFLHGTGDDSGEGRLANAEHGAAEGATGAAVLGPLAMVAGKALSALKKASPNLPPELAKYDPKAVQDMAEIYKEGGLDRSIGGYDYQALKLGQEGTLGDMSPSYRGLVAGFAKRPSEEMTSVVNRYETRANGATQRLDDALTSELGAPLNVPQTIEKMRSAATARATPWYDQFRATPIKPSENMYGILDRAKKAGAFDSAQKLMEMDGIDPNKATGNGQFLDLIKRGLDSKIEAAKSSGDRTLVRSLTGIASDLRTETDAILRSQGAYAKDAAGKIIKDPKTNLPKSIYQHARDVAGEDIRLEKAFEDGQGAFDKSLTADQLAYNLNKMSADEKQIFAAGARAQVAHMADRASTKWGENGDAAMRSALLSRDAERKLEIITGAPQKAGRILDALKREVEFDKTASPALTNSVTALAQAAQKRIPGPVEINTNLKATTLEGAVAHGVKSIVDTLTSNAITERNIRHASDMARMLIANGAHRDAIAQGLQKVLKSQALTAKQRTAIQRVANKVIYGTVPAAHEQRRQSRSAGAPSRL